MKDQGADVEMAVAVELERRHEDAPKVEGKTIAGVHLEWRDITYDVVVSDPNEKGKEVAKTLIHPMSGAVRPGELCAIMGSSGAGKSTLLDILAGRLISEQLSGEILTNGQPIDSNFRKISGYVMQSDALFPLLTVRETFRFAALLRISGKSVAEKEQVVDDLIAELRLERAADTIVGDENHRGVSGGEKRRVSIGVDIIHRPSVIFLDEPTSGLDSVTALSVVECIHTIARHGKTVVVTVHQPSNKVFRLFDRVIFLAHGYVTYFGRTSELGEYILDICKKMDIPHQVDVNLPEFFLEISDQLTEAGQLDRLVQNHKSDGRHPSRQISSLAAFRAEAEIANDIFNETLILSKRALLNILRTKELFYARVGLSIFIGIVIGTLFLHSGLDDKGVNQRVGYIIFLLAFFYWTSLEALPIFLNEREIFQREFGRGAYRAVSYVMANSVVYFPFHYFIALIFSAVSWFLVGMGNTANAFLFMTLTAFISISVAHVFCIWVASVVPDALAGNGMGSGILANMFLFSGFFVKKPDIPKWWIWFYYLSMFKWSFDSMVVNALKQPNISDWKDRLKPWGLQDESRWTGFGVLCAFYVMFRTLFYYMLITKYTGQRRT